MDTARGFSIEYKAKINERIVFCDPNEFVHLMQTYDYVLDDYDKAWADDWLKVEADLIPRLPAWSRLFGFRTWLIKQCRYIHWRGFGLGIVAARRNILAPKTDPSPE